MFGYAFSRPTRHDRAKRPKRTQRTLAVTAIVTKEGRRFVKPNEYLSWRNKEVGVVHSLCTLDYFYG